MKDTESERAGTVDTLGRRDFASIGLVSATLIVFQIALTRILSVVAWYHFAFLTISMVMLGLGVPGVWFAFMRRPQRWLPGLLVVSGITVPASAVLLLRWGAQARSESPLLLILFVLPAMLALGAVVCLLLMRAAGPNISRMYGVDLLGACAGAVAVIPLLHWVPTPALVVGAGLPPLLARAFYPGKGRIAAAIAAVAVLFVLPSELLRVTRSKVYDESTMTLLFEKWSPIARLAVFDWSTSVTKKQQGGFAWGKGSRTPSHEGVREYWLEQDGSAGTPITEFKGDFAPLKHLLYDVTTIAYQMRPRRNAAIIGAGGGRDILSALMAGVTEVNAIELNPHTIRTLSGPFKEFAGDVYHLPGVRTHAAEGRSFLTGTDQEFDTIQISLIDSWAASAAGAFALAENNLYTSEAFALYHSRLSDTGMLSTSRWLHETHRLIVLARSALFELGVAQPERHLMLAVAGNVGTLLVSKHPYSEQDVAHLDAISRERGFQRVHPNSDAQGPHPELREIVMGNYGMLHQLGISTRPPTDDSPYFFQSISPFADPAALAPNAKRSAGFWFNVESTQLLRDTMVWVTALALGLFFVPFMGRAVAALVSRRVTPDGSSGARRESLSEFARASLYFAAIGAAFMLQESMLIQRFVLYLGHPSHATTVILASLLLGMGIGSLASERIGLDRLERFGALVPVLLAGTVALTPSLFDATLSTSLWLRVLLSCVILVPLGATLGVFFPLGMLRFGDANKPWFWAINGAFGVVASVLSLGLSMQFNFTMVGYASAVLYVVAWLCLRQHAIGVGVSASTGSATESAAVESAG